MLEEVGPIEDTMARLYDEMILIQQAISPLICIQKNAQGVMKLLKIANKEIDQMQEWDAKYLDSPRHLERKDKVSIEIDRVQLRLHLQNYSHLGAQLVSTMVAYNRIHIGFESLTQKHGMPAIITLEAIRGREVIFEETKGYIEQIKHVTKREVLEVTKDIIQQHAFSLVKVHMNLSWFWNNMRSRFKNILTEALEVNMHYKVDFPEWIEDIKKEFKSWKYYITNELHEEENGLSI